MSTSGEAAEQVVRISMEGIEQMLRIAGPGAERIAKLLVSEMKRPKRSKGRASLMALLKQKRPLQIFELDDSSLKKFCQAAKKYGILYHVVKNRKSHDGKCEILVRADDLAQVNRIFQRFKLGVNNKATISQSIEKAKNADPAEPQHTVPGKSAEDRFLDKLFQQPQAEKTENTNPSMERMENARPSAPTLKSNESPSKSKDTPESRPSVRKQLAQYRMQLKEERANTKSPTKATHTKSKKKGTHNHDRI